MKKVIAILILVGLLVGFVASMIMAQGLMFALTTLAIIAACIAVGGIACWAVLALMGEV